MNLIKLIIFTVTGTGRSALSACLTMISRKASPPLTFKRLWACFLLNGAIAVSDALNGLAQLLDSHDEPAVQSGAEIFDTRFVDRLRYGSLIPAVLAKTPGALCIPTVTGT